MKWLVEKYAMDAGLHEAVKPLSSAQLKKLDSAASEYGGKRTKMPAKTSISPTLQSSLSTWVFTNDGDAEEFETFAVDEMNLKANTFKYKGSFAVEVYA